MKCPACSSSGPFEDGFCTRCGLEQPAARLPVRHESRPLPAIWREAAPVVVRGLALVAAGVAAEWLLRNGARRAATRPLPAPRLPNKTPAKRETQLVEEVVAFSQTVVRRRVVVRR
jgi:hypothetical protein